MKLIGLKPSDYEHPLDKKALDTLKSNVLLRKAMTELVHYGVERVQRIQYTGSCLKISDKNYPEMHQLLSDTCETLGLDKVPDFYMQWEYALNAMTTGEKQPLIIAYSGLFDLLTEKEIQYILGHEVGHILSHHVLYHMIVEGSLSITGMASFLGGALELPLFYWYRMSELTGDRAGLLACQDFKTAISAMIKMAGLPKSQYDRIDIDAFLEQAREFRESYTGMVDETIKFLSIAQSTHPWLVLRAAELLEWVESGEYDRILNSKKAIVCPHCDLEIPADASICPYCSRIL